MAKFLFVKGVHPSETHAIEAAKRVAIELRKRGHSVREIRVPYALTNRGLFEGKLLPLVARFVIARKKLGQAMNPGNVKDALSMPAEKWVIAASRLMPRRLVVEWHNSNYATLSPIEWWGNMVRIDPHREYYNVPVRGVVVETQARYRPRKKWLREKLAKRLRKYGDLFLRSESGRDELQHHADIHRMSNYVLREADPERTWRMLPKRYVETIADELERAERMVGRTNEGYKVKRFPRPDFESATKPMR
ncbi:hypothetical protein KJ765_01500 [Candidatus Micrarchaeota archaeon]|nr:hypothetical protein [Candidatus Micrarchaeota archaeon]